MGLTSRSHVPVVVLNDTRIDRHHGCFAVMSAIERLAQHVGMNILATSPAHHDWQQDSDFLRAAEKARLVIVNGEGTIHHDRPAGEKLLRVAAFAHDNGIPAAIINAGWEANGAGFHDMLRQFTLVAVRDSQSGERLRRKGQSCTVVPDLSLYAHADAVDPAESKPGAVVFSDSVNRFAAVALDQCRRKVGGEMLSIVYPVSGIAGYAGFLRGGFAKQDLRSPSTLRRLIAMRHRLYVNSSCRIEDFLTGVSRAALLVSGRFHACTLALKTGTPFIAIPSNTSKIAALISDAGLDHWRQLTELSPDAVSDARQKGWSQSERAAVAEYLHTARVGAENLFRDLRAMC